MNILQRNNEGKWVRVERRSYDDEAHLQDLLANDVMVLPVKDIGYDSQFVTIGKEVSLKNGYLDLLAVSPQGHIVLIETKLDKNPEVKRTVVGQILGYASYLWNKDYATVEGYFQSFLRQRKISFTGSLADYVKERIGDDNFSEAEFRAGIEKRLQLGSFSLFIVVDQANQELQDIANYLNDRTGQEVDFYVIELDLIGNDDDRFLIPRLTNPPRKTVTAVGGISKKQDQYDRTPMNEEAFLLRITPEAKSIAIQLLNAFRDDVNFDIMWRKTGFSILSRISADLTKGTACENRNPTYSYFFFQAGPEGLPEKTALQYWYPEASYENVSSLRPLVENYRQFYKNLPGYDEKFTVRDLSRLSSQHIEAMIQRITETGRSFASGMPSELESSWDESDPKIVSHSSRAGQKLQVKDQLWAS